PEGPSLLSRKKIYHRPVLPWCLVGLTLATGPTRAAEPRATVALVLDTSGSLTRADPAEARDLATGALQALPPGSEVASFSFAGGSSNARGGAPRAALRRSAPGLLPLSPALGGGRSPPAGGRHRAGPGRTQARGGPRPACRFRPHAARHRPAGGPSGEGPSGE